MVSWHAVALHFADRGTPCALLDRSAKVELFSSALERIVGIEREVIEGREWTTALAPEAHAPVARTRVARALAGTLRAFDTEVQKPDGTRLKLSVDASLVGRDEEQGLLLTVTAAVPLELESGPRLQDEIDYEISASVADFGRLVRLRTPARPTPTELGGTDRCYAVLNGRGEPCPDCPALQQAGAPTPRTAVRRLGSQQKGYQVITAEGSEGHVRVRQRRISEETLAAIHESKVTALAEEARLSERERAVLTYLLMGRSLADIAVILDISPRTVKFHQANILEKLGADSRADLARLVT